MKNIYDFDTKTQANAVDGELGRLLQSVRKERGYSLADVAKATSISRSFLSLVETGKSDITTARLMRLAKFYEVHIADLFEQGTDDGAVALFRRSNHRKIESAEGIQVSLLAPGATGEMMPAILTFAPQAAMVEAAQHEGEEFVHVLEGELCMRFASREPIVLGVGDSVYFRAEIPHTYVNEKGSPLRIFVVVTPPSY